MKLNFLLVKILETVRNRLRGRETLKGAQGLTQLDFQHSPKDSH